MSRPSLAVTPNLGCWGRAYFAAQAVAGLCWWAAVFLSPPVREATLGRLDPLAVAAFDIPLFVVCSAVAAFGVKAAAVVATGWTAVVAIALAVFATVSSEAGLGVLMMLAAAACSAVALCCVLLGRLPTEWIVRGPFAFRPADEQRGVTAHVGATLGQMALFWGFFLLVVPVVISWLEQRWLVSLALPPLSGVIGVGILVLASCLGVASAVTMSSRGSGTPLPSAMPNRLVIAGPYRWVRNPMAVAGITQGVGVGLILGSWLVIAYALIGSLLWNYAVRPLEETDLENRFGAEFRHYRDSVRCWIPSVRRN
ncbi:Protein-S-isoprenylcysteine O-methyltransferase Ste14 [Arthrobacter sp. cf158]|nr:Protein-S-isoprenylcysteine O-methyltransferase Ste14 [Arthrobacter sp. cf158]